MSIDKAIDIMENYEEYGFLSQENGRNKAINTMRKYQRIEQILSDWINDDSVGMSDYWMGRIKEVLEDGNDD